MNEELLRLLRALLWIKDTADGKKATLGQQGQGMDGYSELANYRQLVEEMRKHVPEDS
jgi:hypothetical protein